MQGKGVHAKKVMHQLLGADFKKPRITRISQMITDQTEKCMGEPSASCFLSKKRIRSAKGAPYISLGQRSKNQESQNSKG